MDLTSVGGELVEYSKKQLFWGFRFLSAVMWARFLKLKRVTESENRYGRGRTGRICCAGLSEPVSTRLRTTDLDFLLKNVKRKYSDQNAYIADKKQGFQQENKNRVKKQGFRCFLQISFSISKSNFTLSLGHDFTLCA